MFFQYTYFLVLGLCLSARSTSLSGDGRFLALGRPWDSNNIGATWVFAYDGEKYTQLGEKLVGSGYQGYPEQGEGESLGYHNRCSVMFF